MAKKPRSRLRAVFALLVTVVVAFLVFGERRRDEPLRVPVQGVRAVDLRSTWHALRSGGRQHKGADIFAPRGTPVLAATRGTVVRVGVDSLGGKVVWVLGPGPTLFYYAHLDDWNDVTPGCTVSAGRVLGFVGNTGNARTTPSHLHFGVYRVGFFSLKAVDPVPLLRHMSTG